jgi:hypothetical protein
MRGLLALALAGLALPAGGCTKSQILPVTIAGVGCATMTSGLIYGGTRPEGSGFFGEDSADAATIGGLVFGGLALAITGVLFSITSADCDTDADCWSGDVCVAESRTCVAAESLLAPPAGEPAEVPAAPSP